jgi:SAM-dependent methyltransferase
VPTELEYHEKLYSGFAQSHFAKAAVRALRAHMVERILRVSVAARNARVLSLGCGIGDTELLLAPRVGELVGVDLSPSAVRQAREDARAAGIANAVFVEGTVDAAPAGNYDLVMAIFFLHHLPDEDLAALPRRVLEWLAPGGVFYSLDPSRRRLSGAIGRLLIPGLMRKYQSPGERELDSGETAALFRAAGLECRSDFYDFVSSPLAGLFPSWSLGYRGARGLDDLLLRLPPFRALGSNFELIARRPR